MLKRHENQEQLLVKKSSRSDILGSSWYMVARDIMPTIHDLKSVQSVFIALYFYDYFSTETGAKKQYKHFHNHELEKNIKTLSRSGTSRALIELEEVGLFIILDLKKDGKIAVKNNEAGKQIIQDILDGKINFITEKVKKSWTTENIISLKKDCPTSETNTKVVPPVKHDVPPVKHDVPYTGQAQHVKTIASSDLEPNFKKCQETSSLKETFFIKKPQSDLLGSSKEKNFIANLFDDLEKIDWVFKNDFEEKKEVKCENKKTEMQKTIEPKKVFSENKQDQVKKDFPELQHEQKRTSEAIKDLTDNEREVQAFLTKDLEILNQDLFFSFVRKLPNDFILSKARYVLEKMSTGKVTSPEGFLRAILSKELAKNETSGNVDVTGLVKKNDYKPIILYFSNKKMIGNKDRNVTNTNRIDDYANIEKNKSCIAFEIYSIYCKAYKENKQEYMPILADIFNDIKGLIHLHDFKEILATNSYIDSVKDVLVEMFRGEK